jgi:hypothetical protein
MVKRKRRRNQGGKFKLKSSSHVKEFFGILGLGTVVTFVVGFRKNPGRFAIGLTVTAVLTVVADMLLIRGLAPNCEPITSMLWVGGFWPDFCCRSVVVEDWGWSPGALVTHVVGYGSVAIVYGIIGGSVHALRKPAPVLSK